MDSEHDSDEPKDEQPAIRLNLYGQVHVQLSCILSQRERVLHREG